MNKANRKRLAGYGLVLVGFVVLYVNFFVVREADEFYGVVAGTFLVGGFGLLIDKSSTQ